MKYMALFLLLGACSTQAVRMASPSGQIITCGPYDVLIAGHEASAVMLERGCVDDYARQGFVRVP